MPYVRSPSEDRPEQAFRHSDRGGCVPSPRDRVRRIRPRSVPSNCADVVVGNPPWGAPKSGDSDEIRSDGGIAWCQERGLSVGNKERSQTFVHRSLDLLRPNGKAGLLLSTGVFFKRHKNTKLFREQWLEKVTLDKVVNFAAVRDAFFRSAGEQGDSEISGSIAPFASVVFRKRKPSDDSRFMYWSAKETAFVKRVQAVILNRADLRIAAQVDYERDDTLWKVYWWGGHRDEELIQRLRLEASFRQVVDPDGERMRRFSRGVQKGPGWMAEAIQGIPD